MSHVQGVGVVLERGYAYLSERAEYRNTVSVVWDSRYARPIQKQPAWFRALNELDVAKFNQLFSEDGQPREDVPPVTVKPSSRVLLSV